MIAVIIDSREPPNIQDLDFGAPKVVTALDAGDIVVTCDDGNTIVVERKTPGDLLGSIKDGRLFQQCHAMRELSEFCYVAIIGTLYCTSDGYVQIGARKTGWNFGAVQGALLTVQEIGVGVVYASDFKTCVERLAQRDRDGVNIHPRRASEPMGPDEAFLASLPGIGALKAQRILANGPACFALDWLTNIWDDYGLKVSGIGWNQKVRIREILGLKGNNREYLTVNLWENEENGE